MNKDIISSVNSGELLPEGISEVRMYRNVALRDVRSKEVKEAFTKSHIPEYKTSGSAGMDLVACIAEPIILSPHGKVLIGTGIAVAMHSPDLVAIVASRSGLYWNHQIRVGQGIGTIDSDYHGEIGVMLANDGIEDYTIEPGERIAQLLFMPVEQVRFTILDNFDSIENTERGSGGFGHTGRK